MTCERTIALVALCIAVGGCAAGAGSSGRGQYLGSHPWDIASLDAASRTTATTHL